MAKKGGKAKVKKEEDYDSVVAIRSKKRGAGEIDAPDDGYAKFTVKTLNEIIKNRGLEKNGAKIKADLITILETADIGSAGGEKKEIKKSDSESEPALQPELQPESESEGEMLIDPDVEVESEGEMLIDTEVDPVENVVALDEAPKYSSMTIPQLNELIKDRNLAKDGAKNKMQLVDLLERADADPNGVKKNKAPKAKPEPYIAPENYDKVDHNSRNTGEVRLREYVPYLDQDTQKRLWKAKNERMFMLSRSKTLDQYGDVQETFQITGSSGNIYDVVFNKTPGCNCMDAKIRQNRCKHVLYVKCNILKVAHNLIYQSAYLSSELEQIYADAPKTERPVIPHDQVEDELNYNGKRKAADGDCSICMMEFEEGEELVWCKAACGQNFHKQCFDQYRKHTATNRGRMLCAYCRTPWQEDDPSPKNLYDDVIAQAPKIKGYKNIGHLAMYQTQGEASGAGK